MDYQEASNKYDMLKGCVNRMFVTDDMEELPKLHHGALYCLGLIYKYGVDCLADPAEDKKKTEYLHKM